MEITDSISLQVGYPWMHLVPSAVHCHSISLPLNITNIPEIRNHNSVKKRWKLCSPRNKNTSASCEFFFVTHLTTKRHPGSNPVGVLARQKFTNVCVSRRMTLRYRTQYTCLIPFSSSYVNVLSPYSFFIGIQPLGQSGQRPEFSQTTGMALVLCILGKFLGVACHCFPPLFRRSHFSPPGASTSATTWEIPAAEVGTVDENVVR